MSLFGLKAVNITTKKFDYELNGVTLDFTLRVDVKKELKSFKELLVRGLEDVNTELEKF